MGRIVSQSLKLKDSDNAQQASMGITISRKELYGLFVLAMTLPFITFASGVYLGKPSSKPEMAEVAEKTVHLPDTAALALESPPAKMTASVSSSPEMAEQFEVPPKIETNAANTNDKANADLHSVAQTEPQISESHVSLTQTNVTVETPESTLTPVSHSQDATIYTSAPRSRPYIVQVGLFTDAQSAQTWRTGLHSQYQYWIIPRIYPDGSKKYSVILGFYKNKIEASAVADDYETLTQSDAYVTQLTEQQIEKTLANL